MVLGCHANNLVTFDLGMHTLLWIIDRQQPANSQKTCGTIVEGSLTIPTSTENENVYIVYLLSPLTTTDFRISDGIPKVVNASIA